MSDQRHITGVWKCLELEGQMCDSIQKGKEIMKKFMKFCFVLALVLIVVGGLFYMIGRRAGGRQEMDELLTEIGGGWVDFDWEDYNIGFTGYDIDDVSMFHESYTIWKGDVEKQMIYQGNVEELNLEIGGSMVEVKNSQDGNIYIEGSSLGKMQAYVEEGVLYVKSVRPANLMEEIKNSSITLYLPEDCTLERLDLSLGAGQLKLGDMVVQDMTASVGAGQLLMTNVTLGALDVSLGAGELRTQDVTVQTLAASIGAGNMDFTGAVNESAEISCNMGNVNMSLTGNKQDFNYQLSCVAGSMKVDGDVFGGAAVDRDIDNGADKYMQISCSMGNVEVDFQ